MGYSAWDHRNNVTFSYVWSPKGLSSGNTFANVLLGGLTRHWTLSGVERFQSGPYSTVNFSGYDSNQDGSTANDRPILSNPSAPLDSVGIDTTYLPTAAAGGNPANPGTQGTYYNLKTYNTTSPKQKTLVDPSQVHWLIQRGQRYLQQEVGRDTFLNPGYQQHDVALEKGFGLSAIKFDRGTLNLRCEANDIGNHNNVAPLGLNLAQTGTSTFLNPVVSRTVSSRSLVLWARLLF